MKNKFLIITLCLLTMSPVAFYSIPVFAEEDIKALKQQIESLQKRVEELESENKIKQESQTTTQDDDFFWGRRQRGWDPFYEMQRMQEEMKKMFQSSYDRRGDARGGLFSNNISFNYDFDIKETKEGYEIIFNMKGFNKDKVNIQIDEHSITVQGEYEQQKKEESQNGYYSSQSFGTFIKTIPVPIDADTTKVKTEKDGDKLVIKLPKKTS